MQLTDELVSGALQFRQMEGLGLGFRGWGSGLGMFLAVYCRVFSVTHWSP